MQSPVVALARLFGRVIARYFDKAVVQRQVVAYGVLPALRVLFKIGKALLDEVVDLVQGHHARRGALYGHGDESYVRIGRLDFGKAAFLLRERRGATKIGHVDDSVVQFGD